MSGTSRRLLFTFHWLVVGGEETEGRRPDPTTTAAALAARMLDANECQGVTRCMYRRPRNAEALRSD